jgi:hypothetical protein
MKFNQVLNESYQRAILKYKGTRENYKIKDPSPYIMIIDQKYNVDGKGESILGLNLNYFDGNVDDLIDQINAFDNELGFRGFEGKLKFKKLLKKKDVGEWESSQRKKRYEELMAQFPFLKQYVRRYKKSGPKGTGIKSKKRKVMK